MRVCNAILLTFVFFLIFFSKKGKNINKVVSCNAIPRVNLSKFKYKGTFTPADETAQLEDILELLRELENDERNK